MLCAISGNHDYSQSDPPYTLAKTNINLTICIKPYECTGTPALSSSNIMTAVNMCYSLGKYSSTYMLQHSCFRPAVQSQIPTKSVQNMDELKRPEIVTVCKYVPSVLVQYSPHKLVLTCTADEVLEMTSKVAVHYAGTTYAVTWDELEKKYVQMSYRAQGSPYT